MVAVDSSTLIAYIQGQSGADVQLFAESIRSGEIALPPAVLAEVLSEPHLPALHAGLLRALPTLEIHDGYWLRVAETRAKVISRKLRARLPDALIAQSCIDHDVALITRDADLRHFAKHCGLKLA
jgi:predicted nucleic acid-binding protein